MYRVGAIPSLGMVNIFEDAISKKNVFPCRLNGPRQGNDWQTFLAVKAWVNNVASTKGWTWTSSTAAMSPSALTHIRCVI
jgi:hypothetical protein